MQNTKWLRSRIRKFRRSKIKIERNTTSTNLLRFKKKLFERRKKIEGNETTRRRRKKKSRRLGNRVEKKRMERGRKEVDLPPRGDTAATSSINNIASWPRSFDI